MAAVFVNRLTTTDVETFEALYAEIADFMLAQPGLQRYMLVRSQRDPQIYFNIAEWDTPGEFQAAIASERFQWLFARLRPLIAGDPQLCDVLQYGAPGEVSAAA